MSGSAPLERHYRRLLSWFPPEHRRVYGEEMIGVLLSSAPDGQDRPAAGEITDLVSSGLRVRLRNWTGIERVDAKWADALAAFSVAAPILMAGFASFQLYVAVRYRSFFANFAPFRRDASFLNRPSPTHEVVTWLLLDATAIAAVAALIVAPVLLRRNMRRSVRLIAGAVVLLGLVATVNFDAGWLELNDVQVGFTTFFLLELAAVAISPDPGRAWRTLTGKGVIIVGVIAAAAVIAETLLQGAILQSLRMNGNVVLLAALAVGIAVIMIFGSDAHKRLLALFAIPAYPLLAYNYLRSQLFRLDRPVPFVQVLYLPTLVIAALVALAIWQASRTRPGSGQPEAGVTR